MVAFFPLASVPVFQKSAYQKVVILERTKPHASAAENEPLARSPALGFDALQGRDPQTKPRERSISRDEDEWEAKLTVIWRRGRRTPVQEKYGTHFLSSASFASRSAVIFSASSARYSN